jgi:GT2 family glycosyltransferase
MKFENKYPEASTTDRFEFEYSYVTKTPKLGQCRWCRSFTKWFDVIFMHHACSEECLGTMWRQYREDQKKNSTYDNFEAHFDQVKIELKMAQEARNASKDILIVVHNQLEWFRQCVDSLRQNTSNYHLYIWDNGSGSETQDYIRQLHQQWMDEEASKGKDIDWGITSQRVDDNKGFIYPNNELIDYGHSEFVILLNSDCKVFEWWDRAMTGFLDLHPDVGEVGYWGGHMGPDGRGFGGSNGYDIDYVPGWCLCMRRQTYERYGLFNKQLTFAYCEDADLSLRLKEAGLKIYALHAPLVHHYQNKTIIEVERAGAVNVRESFDANHAFLKERWKDYLANERVLLKKSGKDSTNEHLANPVERT